MSFRDFSFPKVEQDLGLHVRDADLFPRRSKTAPMRDSIADVCRTGAIAFALAHYGIAKTRVAIGPSTRLAGYCDSGWRYDHLRP